jgi:adenylate cyclase
VLVVWTPTSVASRWVRGEAREAAERGILVPVRFEKARLPMDVRAIHTTDLDEWAGNATSQPAQDFLRALDAMIARSQAAQATKPGAASAAAPEDDAPRVSICVLPFANMSGDSEQEYFSDGMTEDITTDLSKVSALAVASSNSAFMYKGQHVEIAKVARELNVTHVLEGSVRKAGGRIRVNAQLIDGATNNHVWAERYDRDASDIFAIQDEISKAIVKALRLRLLPEEKKAIERRGTNSVEAHDLYLMARQIYITSQEDVRAAEAIVSTCTRATEIDPEYAQAWALLAMGYRSLRQLRVDTDDGMAAAERALALNPNLAEAHAVKAYILVQNDATESAIAEVEIALRQDPESYEANRTAGRIAYQMHRFKDAALYYQKAVSLMDTDVNSAMMLVASYHAVGDTAAQRQAAGVALKRADAVLARDQNNGGIMVYSALALAALGEAERAKTRMNRALLVDPHNWTMRYNFACTLNNYLNDEAAAIQMLEPLFETIPDTFLAYAKADPDLGSLREDVRFKAMVAAAETRLAAAKTGAAAPATEVDSHG